MSFTRIESTAPARLYRSKLFVPGSRPALFEKAAASAADVICLDLEDAVAPADKEAARDHIVQALKNVDWGVKTVTVRINGLDTNYCYRDVLALVEKGGERLDAIMIPKVGCAADVYAIDMLISQASDFAGRKKRIGLEVIIETTLGLSNIDAIAASSKRLESLHFGSADYAASQRMRTTNIGGGNADYAMLTDKQPGAARERHWNDLWHYPLFRMTQAARAYGLMAIDGPFGDYSDADGFRAQAKRTATLGCEGKWAIHPSQVALANEIYTPPAREVERAEAILAAMKDAQSKGLGAVALNGVLIDAASIRQAETIVRQMAMIRERAGG
ncbi:MAG TPA: CoA ester lyase [Rhizomicrobium sp.]|jgi:malyl-CoA/(S)-citramalyl-CoA lyase|nr:CoA ester lyase [Rhizomicrobium sp.]